MNDALIYGGVFGVVFMLNYLSVKVKKRFWKIALVVTSIMVLVVFVGLRSNVGTDYSRYVEEYEKIKGMSWGEIFSQRTEFFVVLIYKLFSCIFHNYHWIFFMYGALSIIPIYAANKLFDNKYLAYSMLTYCLMFLPFVLNGMRQGVSLGFVVLSTACLMKEQHRKAVIALIFAFLFHLSSLVFVPFYILYVYCRKKKKKYKLLSAILAVTVLSALFIFQNAGLYSGYFNNISFGNISLGSLVTYAPVLVLTFAYDKRKIIVGEKNTDLLSGNISSGMVFQVVGTAVMFMNRLALYFMPSLVLLMPMVIQCIEDPLWRRIVKVGYVTYLVVLFVVEYIVMGRHGIVPYSTWL